MIRKVKVLPSKDGQFYYVAQGGNGEKLYASETFTRREDALDAARREHTARFDYVLEYEDADGVTVKEVL